VNGHPTLNTDVNCGQWCDQDLVGQCGAASTIFCTNYPNHPACQCQYFINTPEFKIVQSAFESVPPSECKDCGTFPDPACWASPCLYATGEPDRPLYTSQQYVILT
jgi:hypothetical protein